MDLEAIKTLKESMGWRELVEEIDRMVSANINVLKTAKDNVIYLQQKIQALEELKSLPDSILEREE